MRADVARGQDDCQCATTQMRLYRTARAATPLPMTTHPEQQYLDAMARAWNEGDERVDRTGVGTRSLFGVQMRFDLSDGTVPLITTKKIFWKSAVRELIWFLSGDTNIRPLVEQRVHIWTDWPLDAYRKATGDIIDRDAFERRIIEDDAFAARWGDLGPVYGKQWVDWPRYSPAGNGLFRRDEQGVNQIADLVAMLRDNPSSRRLIFTGWNVPHLAEMALPPCHMTYQYHVANGRLSGILYQRSCDLGLGFPFNIFEAARDRPADPDAGAAGRSRARRTGVDGRRYPCLFESRPSRGGTAFARTASLPEAEPHPSSGKHVRLSRRGFRHRGL